MQCGAPYNNTQPKLVFLAILAAYAIPRLAMAENKVEALQLSKIEVVGTTPLPSIGISINQVPANVQTGSSQAFAQQQSLDSSDLDSNLGSFNTSNSVANPYQADVQFRGFTASPLLGTPQGISFYGAEFPGIKATASAGFWARRVFEFEAGDLDLSIALVDTMMEGTQAVLLSTFDNSKQAYTYLDSI